MYNPEILESLNFAETCPLWKRAIEQQHCPKAINRGDPLPSELAKQCEEPEDVVEPNPYTGDGFEGEYSPTPHRLLPGYTSSYCKDTDRVCYRCGNRYFHDPACDLQKYLVENKPLLVDSRSTFFIYTVDTITAEDYNQGVRTTQ
jgi:hypothetical protein